MDEVRVRISGGPQLEPPEIPPPLPENPDLSGLRNMMEEAVDEGQQRQAKAPSSKQVPDVPAGVAAMLVCDAAGVVSWLAVPAAVAGMPICSTGGVISWLEAAVKGLPVVGVYGNSSNEIVWLPTGTGGGTRYALNKNNGGMWWYDES